MREIRERIELVDCDNVQRFEGVKRLFVMMGAAESDIDIQAFENVKNVTITLKGRSDEKVIIGAHYDKTTLGCGAIDNWSGVVILTSLYDTLKTRQTDKTLQFVAFGKEERGLIGSRAMATDLSPSVKKNVCSMVNLDSFGFESMWTMSSISDKPMIELGKRIAKRRGQRFDVKNFRGASSDSTAFQEQGIPAITLSGVGNDWRDYLHQKGDQVKNVDIGKVYQNYLFALDYLNELDRKSCDAFR